MIAGRVSAKHPKESKRCIFRIFPMTYEKCFGTRNMDDNSVQVLSMLPPRMIISMPQTLHSKPYRLILTPRNPGLPWLTWESSHFKAFHGFRRVLFSGKELMVDLVAAKVAAMSLVSGTTVPAVLLSEFMHAAESVQVALPEPS